ncbi:patatin-like phospholipase family protein [Salinispira pacifica]
MDAPRIGIALGSGGAKGMCHIAFLEALDELNRRPAVMAGASIGAMLAAYYAGGMSGREMREVAEDMDLGDFTRMLDISLLKGSFIIGAKGIRSFLERTLPVKRFEELEIPLRVVATDFWNRRPVVFESGNLIDAIHASIALPGIIEPYLVGNAAYIDGGAVNPLPFDLIRDECDILVAVDVSGKRKPGPRFPAPGILENLLNTFQILEETILREKLERTQVDLYVKPAVSDVRILDFHRIDSVLEAARPDVDDFKARLKALTAG